MFPSLSVFIDAGSVWDTVFEFTPRAHPVPGEVNTHRHTHGDRQKGRETVTNSGHTRWKDPPLMECLLPGK